jgi:hypothetical protein
MVMKNKLFIIVLFLIIGNKAFSQIDTLDVYLEKSSVHTFGVNLVFENNSNDTILLLTKFRNLSLGGEIPHVSGICICFYYNNQPFTFNWGELPPLNFIFSEGFTVINPKSKVKLIFNIGEYFKFPEESKSKYEISFFINYIFTKYHQSEIPKKIEYFETNRVVMLSPDNITEIY